MRSIIVSLVLAVLGLTTAGAQTKINPVNQVKWPTCSAGQAYSPATNTCIASSTGVPYDAATVDYFIGGSDGVIATIRTTTATAFSCNGTTCTVTDANSYVPGQWVEFLGNVGGYPMWNPTCANFAIVQVVTASPTQFTYLESQGVTPGRGSEASCSGVVSGTGGTVQDGTNLYPFQTCAQNYFTRGGTFTPTCLNRSWPGDSLATEDANYTTLFHSEIAAHSGSINVWIDSGGNDLAACASAATTEGHLDSLISKIKADGGKVFLETVSGGPTYDSLSCPSQDQEWASFLQYERAAQCTQIATSTCADVVADSASFFSYSDPLFVQSSGVFSGHYTDKGAGLAAAFLNLTIQSHGGFTSSGLAGLGSNYFFGTQGMAGMTVNATPGATNGGVSILSNSGNYMAYNTSPINNGTHVLGYYSSSAGAPMHMYTANSIVSFAWRTGPGFTDLINDPSAGISTDITNHTWHLLSFGNGVNANDVSGGWHATYGLFQGLASDPVSPIDGMCWYNSTSHVQKCNFNGTVTSYGGASYTGLTPNAIQWATSSSATRAATATDLSGISYVADSGTADVYAATLAPAIGSYTAGLTVRVKIANTNTTTTPTLNVNALGTKTIVKNGAAALVAGDVAAGQIQTFQYDGTNFQLLNPATAVSSVVGSSPIVVTNIGGVYTASCPTCGTSTSTAANMNGGATLGTLQITGNTTQACSDTSGSGTAQVCNTTTTFTPWTNACIVYSTTTANSGSGLTINVNSFGVKSVAVPSSSVGWTTTLTAGIIPANKPLNVCYDGTNWNVAQTGNSTPVNVTFNVATGAVATPAAYYLNAPTSGVISHCYFTTTTSDGATNLVFNVKLAGTNIISGTNATVTAATAAKTVSTFNLTSGVIAVTAGNQWEFDISTGTSAWTGVVQCY